MPILEKITDSIYAHTDGKTIGNVGLIAGQSGNYIIDTSMYPVMARDLREEIKKIRSGKVLGAILTHYHFDHTGGNQAFHDVGLHSHRNVLENMKQNYNQEEMEKGLEEREDKELFEGMELTYPDKIFETNPYSPDNSEQIEVYHTGGHTSGSSLIFFKEENAIFAGDNLFAGLYPWGGDPSASPYKWIEAMEFMKESDPDIIIPGHGSVQYNLKEVDDLLSYLNQVRSTGEKLIKENTDKEKVLESLSEIDAKPEKTEGMKERTLNHWYGVISNKVKI